MNFRRQQLKGDKLVFLFSLLAFTYFSLLILTSQLQYNPVFLGVVRELVTLPAIVGVMVLLALSGMAFVKGNFRINTFPFYSLLLLALTITVMVVFA